MMHEYLDVSKCTVKTVIECGEDNDLLLHPEVTDETLLSVYTNAIFS